MVELECEECGKEFTHNRVKRFCSKECQDINWRRRKFGMRACKQCGKEYLPYHKTSHFCSERCNLDYHRYNTQGKQPAEEKICPVCGKAFVAQRDYSRDREQKYCSFACAGVANRKEYTCLVCGDTYYVVDGYNTEYCSQGCRDEDYTKECEWCGEEFVASRPNVLYCSDKCREECARERTRLAYMQSEMHLNKTHEGVCVECGRKFTNGYGEKRRKFCSEKCGAWHYKRINKSKRRARMLGREHEPIDPIKVFTFASWRCEKCGAKTPRRLRGTTHDRAPELDHIVALANGGTHTWDNVQCLCRKCNQEKGAETWGQARLPLLAVEG